MWQRAAGLLGPDGRKLLANVTSLGLTQGINLVLPVLVMPYLLRVIGVERFGVVMVAQALMAYLLVITEYGFSITATQEAAVQRDDQPALSALFRRVLTAKAVLLLLSFGVLVILVSTVDTFRREAQLFYLSFGIVIGKTLFPIWFFQGVERMTYMAYFNVVAKAILLSTLFLFVREAGDYVWVNVYWSVGELLTGLASLVFVRRQFGLSLRPASARAVLAQLRAGGPVFVTNLANSLYMNAGLLLLGFFAPARLVGLYAIADRLLALTKQLIGLLMQATYPHACRLAATSWVQLRLFFRRELALFSGLFLLVGLGLYGLAGPLTTGFAGRPVPEAAHYLRLLSLVPLIVSFNVTAYQIMLIHRLSRGYVGIVVTGAVLNIGLNLLLIPIWSALGTIIAILVTELVVTLLFHLILHYQYPAYRLVAVSD